MAVNALAAAGDVLIAFVLCLMLQKSRTGFRRPVSFSSSVGFAESIVHIRSDTMIKKLVR